MNRAPILQLLQKARYFFPTTATLGAAVFCVVFAVRIWMLFGETSGDASSALWVLIPLLLLLSAVLFVFVGVGFYSLVEKGSISPGGGVLESLGPVTTILGIGLWMGEVSILGVYLTLGGVVFTFFAFVFDLVSHLRGNS